MQLRKALFFLSIFLLIVSLPPAYSLAYDDGLLPGETLSITADKSMLTGLTSDTIIFDITNLSGKSQDVNFYFSFDDTEARLADVKVWSWGWEWQNTTTYSQCKVISSCDKNGDCSKTCAETGEPCGSECTYPTTAKKKVFGWAWREINSKFHCKELRKIKYPLSLSKKDFWECGKRGLIYIPKDTTQLFRATVEYPPGSDGQFLIRADGSKGAWGLLDPWWNSAWHKRKQITITNNYAGTLDANKNAVRFPVDTAALITAGDLLSNCYDLRVVCNSAEQDSNVSSCNTADTNVFFNLPENISNGGTNTDCYMYYANPGASAWADNNGLVLPALDYNTLGLYYFNNDATDETGNNDATWAGTPTYSSTRVEGLKSAGTFTAANYPRIPNGAANSLNEGTVEMWVYMDNNTTDPALLVREPQAADGYDFFLQLSSTGAIGWYLGAWWSSTIPAVELGQWTHLAFTWGSSGRRIYKDGVLLDSDGTARTLPDSAALEWHVGHSVHSAESARYFSGYIDDLRFSNFAKVDFFPQAEIDTPAERPTAALSGEEKVKNMLTIFVTDENSGLGAASVDITLDGNTYITDATGRIDQNIWWIVPGEYSLTLSKTDYTTRSFLLDLNGQDTNTFYLSLLPTALGNSIDFQFYDTDGVTLLGNSIIQVDKVIDNNIYTRVRTDSTGKTTLFLNPQDGNYSFHVIEDDNTTKDYNTVHMTVAAPKYESTKEAIIPTNFDVTISNLQQQDFLDNSSAVSFYLFANTESYYIVAVDVNSEFYGRKYNFSFKGNPQSYSFQPYLTTTANGISTKVLTVNSMDGTRISGVKIDIYKYIAGQGNTLMETVTTDSKGEGLISGVVNDTYSFKVYYNNALINTSTITVTSDTVLIAFNPVPNAPIFPENATIDIGFNPPGGMLIDQNYIYQDINVTNNGTLSYVQIYVTQIDENNSANDVNLYDANYTSGFTYPYTNTIDLNSADMNVWDVNYNIVVTVIARMSDGNQLVRKTTYSYYISSNPSYYALHFLKLGIRDIFGCSADLDTPCGGLMWLAAILSLFACGAVVASTPLRNPEGIGVFFVMVLGVFTYMAWVPFSLFLIVAFLVFIVMVGVWKVMG